MKTQVRQETILHYVQDRKFVYVQELMKAMNVSGATIRRDLNALEAQGKIIREYGKVACRKEPTTMSEASNWGYKRRLSVVVRKSAESH